MAENSETIWDRCSKGGTREHLCKRVSRRKAGRFNRIQVWYSRRRAEHDTSMGVSKPPQLCKSQRCLEPLPGNRVASFEWHAAILSGGVRLRRLQAIALGSHNTTHPRNATRWGGRNMHQRQDIPFDSLELVVLWFRQNISSDCARSLLFEGWCCGKSKCGVAGKLPTWARAIQEGAMG